MPKKNFLRLPSWLHSSRFYRGRLNTSSSSTFGKEPISECHPYDANLISSRKHNGKHNILLDLDFEHHYVESSTIGKGHLYLNANASTEDFEELLTLLHKLNIIEEGYLNAFKVRGHATLRLPGIKKGDYADERWFYDEVEMKEGEIND